MYRKSYDSLDLKCIAILIIITFMCLFGLESCTNAMTEDKWNNGYCPDCEVRYELKGVAGKTYLKYYACPECGEEVERY